MKGLSQLSLAIVALGTALSAQAEQPVLVDLKKYGFSNAAEFNDYMSVSDVSVTETELDGEAAAAFLNTNMSRTALRNSNFSSPLSIIDTIGSLSQDPSSITAWVTLGKEMWELIEKNKPVVNVSTNRVSILPQAQTDWRKMSNWNPRPFAKTYVLEAKNAYGMRVIKHAYTVAFNYGGKYNGKGAFLANATIIPSQVEVAWGYKLNSKVEVGDAINTSSLDNPVPGVNLEVQYSIDTIVKHGSGRDNFFVMGNGAVQRLTP